MLIFVFVLSDRYVYYCMKYVDYLLRNGLKPILVFDGCHLPSKKDVETSRREQVPSDLSFYYITLTVNKSGGLGCTVFCKLQYV